MKLSRHRFLFTFVYGSGMFVGFASMWPILWFLYNIVGLPNARSETTLGTIVGVGVCIFYFWFVYTVARWNVLFWQRYWVAECPRCRQSKARFRFISWRQAVYVCQACDATYDLRGSETARLQ